MKAMKSSPRAVPRAAASSSLERLPRRRGLRAFAMVAPLVATCLVSASAHAQRYAEPPPRAVAYVPADPDAPRHEDPPPVEARRSPVRFSLGPAALSTGSGLGFGLGASIDLGTGSVGGRISAAWLRGEERADRAPSGEMFAHYLGELTIDLNKRGAFHPVFGLGFGVVTVRHGDVGGAAGVGTASAGIEYALGLDDADVRVGMSALGGLIGPQDKDTRDLRGYGLFTAHVAVGF